MNDFELVRCFRQFKGRAYRPRANKTRLRPGAERQALGALIPDFSFAPLRALLDRLGEHPGQLMTAELGHYDAHELSLRLLELLETSDAEDCRELVGELKQLHDKLICERATLGPADLIACPGSRTLSRVVAAHQYWQQSPAEARIAVSGGSPSYERGQQLSQVPEADAYAACLRLWGVPEQAIIGEREASTTLENAAFLDSAIEQQSRRLSRPIHLLLTTSGFHSTRYLLSVLRLRGHSEHLRSVGISPGPSFHGETLAFDEGGQSAVEKIAIVINEYLKIHFDLTRVVVEP